MPHHPSQQSFPRAILHIDGDAFFASCEQARNPALRGRVVVTGKERGIVSSLSYEGKARGLKRAMRLSDVEKLCPDAVILPSDYETYGLLSYRFFVIVRRYTPDVEEYGIDECFADITGLRRQFHMGYRDIAARIQADLTKELGFTFSIGLASTKVLAKLGSKWKKPHGLTPIPNRDIPNYLQGLPVSQVWGIGPQTSAFLAKHGIYTALQFADKDENWILRHLSKPFQEIWQELNGISVHSIEADAYRPHYSVQKMKTFTPPSIDPTFVFGQLAKNIESACIKVRGYKLEARRASIMLRTQDFRHHSLEVKLSRPTNFAHELIGAIEPVFQKLFQKNTPYRGAMVTLFDLEEPVAQPDLFGSFLRVESFRCLYQKIDDVRKKYGKHTLFFGASFPAHQFAQHLGERGDVPERHLHLLRGETKRRRLGIPVFTSLLDEEVV